MKPLGRGGEGGEDGLVVEAVLFRDNVLRLDDLEDIELALELGLLRCAIAKEAHKNHSTTTQRNGCMTGCKRQVEVPIGAFYKTQSSSILSMRALCTDGYGGPIRPYFHAIAQYRGWLWEVYCQ